MDPNDASDATADTDGDSITNEEEIALGTDPLKKDTDNDGIPDAIELENNMNPTNGSDTMDTDGDGLTNDQEVLAGTNPASADSDGDGISVDEMVFGTNPTNADSDGDGQNDGAEKVAGTNANDASDTYLIPTTTG